MADQGLDGLGQAARMTPSLRLGMNALARTAFVVLILLTASTAFSSWTLPLLKLVPWREAAHFAAFFVLTCAAAFSFPRISLARIAVFSGAAGVLSELVQATPWIDRHCSWRDVIADLAGVAAVVAVSLMVRFRQAQAPRRLVRPPRVEAPYRYDRLSRAGRWPSR